MIEVEWEEWSMAYGPSASREWQGLKKDSVTNLQSTMTSYPWQLTVIMWYSLTDCGVIFDVQMKKTTKADASKQAQFKVITCHAFFLMLPKLPKRLQIFVKNRDL